MGEGHRSLVRVVQQFGMLDTEIKINIEDTGKIVMCADTRIRSSLFQEMHRHVVSRHA